MGTKLPILIPKEYVGRCCRRMCTYETKMIKEQHKMGQSKSCW